jgi:hypothetical protein
MWCAWWRSGESKSKSFLVLFFKKELLCFLAPDLRRASRLQILRHVSVSATARRGQSHGLERARTVFVMV